MKSDQSFSDFVNEFGDWEWCILFVEANGDHVSAAYAETTGSQLPLALPLVSNGDHGLGPTGAVVTLADSAWTIIFHSVGTWKTFDAAAFSKKLNARVVAYEAEDTSGSRGCTVYDPGGDSRKLQIASDAESDAELMDEAAEYAEEMGMEFSAVHHAEQIEDYDSFIESFGISLVGVSIADDYSAAIIGADKVGSVAKVVLVRQD